MTSNYGVSRGGRPSQTHENGEPAKPLPIWGKEDHSGMANSASRSVGALPLESMIVDFIKANGKSPTKLHTKCPVSASKYLGKIYSDPISAYIGLDIVYGCHDDYLS